MNTQRVCVADLADDVGEQRLEALVHVIAAFGIGHFGDEHLDEWHHFLEFGFALLGRAFEMHALMPHDQFVIEAAQLGGLVLSAIAGFGHTARLVLGDVREQRGRDILELDVCHGNGDARSVLPLMARPAVVAAVLR